MKNTSEYEHNITSNMDYLFINYITVSITWNDTFVALTRGVSPKFTIEWAILCRCCDNGSLTVGMELSSVHRHRITGAVSSIEPMVVHSGKIPKISYKYANCERY